MRFRMGMVTGFAAGYYMGAKAGRQRYDQINRSLTKLRGSDTFETAAERAKTVVEEGGEKARSLVDARTGDAGAGSTGTGTGTGTGNASTGSGSNGHTAGTTTTEPGIIGPGQPEPPA